jgi:hypothetical protein
MIIGLGGNNGTTVVAGALANREFVSLPFPLLVSSGPFSSAIR